MPADEVALALLTVVAAAIAIAMLLALPFDGGPISPAAQLRAKKLFLSKLSDAERRAWSREGRLTVFGCSGRCYVLSPYDAFNIRCGNEAYCLRVMGTVPPYDKLLAQRLLIECDEPAFLLVANKRVLRF